MPAMTAEVSRALAVFIADLGLGREAARSLADQYAAAASVDDLPDWMVERDDATRSTALIDEVRRFHPDQKRDPDGKWGDGIPGPSASLFDSFEADGFDPITEVEGTFGKLAMGVDKAGDVRLAYHEKGELRELDLGSDEVAELADVVERLNDARDDLPDDAEPLEVYDDDNWGTDHRAELLGNGVIVVTFGDGSDDPWELLLDPPYEADPDDPADEDTNDVQILVGAVDDVLNEVGTERSRADGEYRKFNPNQPRDPGGEDGGQWTSSPGGALKDALKLAGKIDLDDDEKLLGSDRVNGSGGSVRIAVTELDGKRSVRLGLGSELFGGRYDPAGPWRGNRDRSAATKAERERLRDESVALDEELADTTDPARKAAIQKRLDAIDEQLGDAVDDEAAGYTAKIDQGSAERLRSTLADALAAAKKKQAEVDAAYDKGEAEPPRPEQGYWTFAQGSIPGEWADVYYDVEFDDPDVGVEVYLGAVPRGSGETFDDLRGSERVAKLDPAEARKFLRLLAAVGATSRSTPRGGRVDARADKPYGDVQYADPGLQPDGKARYPIDSEAHCKAAWSYVSMPKNAAKYTAEQLAAIKGRIKKAAKKYGIEISDDSGRAADPGDLRYNDQHAPAGSAGGGQFVDGGGGGGGAAKKSTGKKATHARPRQSRPMQQHKDDGTLAYDPGSNQGTGYGSQDGDERVHALQQALNRLGIKDAAGKPLKDDGKLGPKTTSAVKTMQRMLGMKPDGKVTPALLAQIKAMKTAPMKRSAFMDMCVRSFGFEFEERSRTSDGRTLEGYAAVFNTPTRIAAVGGDFDEVINPGAFTRSIRSRMPVLQFEHGRDPRVGAVPIGAINDLAEDSQGLHVRATLFDNPVVEPVRQAIAGRAIKGMSFRFNVVENGDTWQRRTGDVDLRAVGDADVHELGPVVFPAYDTTTVSVRSLLAQLGPEEHRALLRELAYDLRSLDLEESDGRPSARSSGGVGDRPDPVVAEPRLSIRQRLDQGALLARGILK